MQDQGSNNINEFRLFQNQDENLQVSCRTENYNWSTKLSNVNDEMDAQSVDNILDRSGLLDELVCQILDDGITPVEDKPSTIFKDAVNVKEFVPSGYSWPYRDTSSSLPLSRNPVMMGLDSTNRNQTAEQLIAGHSSLDTRPNMPNVQPFTFKGKHVTSTGKVINPPPGFEHEVQAQNTNLIGFKQSQPIAENLELTKPCLSEVNILRHNMISSDMFSPNQSPSNQSNLTDRMSSLNMPKPFSDSCFPDNYQRPPCPAHMAQSLFQRRTNSPLQMLLSETGSGSSLGSIDSPMLSPYSVSGMSNASPSSPFETNANSADRPISVAQANTTRFNFKAPPFIPSTNRPSPSPLGWKGLDASFPSKFSQQSRSESPIEQQLNRNFPFGNMLVDPPPMNRLIRGNIPMQPISLPFSGKSLSNPQDIPNFRNPHSNQSQPAAYFNSSSGRNSPFPFPQTRQSPMMGPHGDSFNNFNSFGQHSSSFPGLKQQGFPMGCGLQNKYSVSGNIFSMQQQQQQPQALDRQSATGRLHIQLDECCIHVKRLEEERKKTEYELARMHPGKRISSSNTIQAPALPENPSQVDRIIVDVYKEHSRLVTLLSKIEGLCTKSLHPNLEACLDAWMTSIQEVEARRQQEIRNSTQCHQNDHGLQSSRNEEELNQLADVIEKMKNATRAARTSLWSAFQMAKEDKENKENVREI